MRSIVLDTETTGLDPKNGHRIVEIGGVEIINFIPTGNTFHCYINPERDMPLEAEQVHGLSASFLAQFPPFSKVARPFLDFIDSSPLIIHNAGFDTKFINFELSLLGMCPLNNPIVCTLKSAKEKFPGSPASLDALCKKFRIDLTKRDKHGALLDALLLAQVYLELNGGLQPHLVLTSTAASEEAVEENTSEKTDISFLAQRDWNLFAPSHEEKARHQELLAHLGIMN